MGLGSLKRRYTMDLGTISDQLALFADWVDAIRGTFLNLPKFVTKIADLAENGETYVNATTALSSK